MTNPTDSRVEAAAREMCLSAVDGDERIWNEMPERDKNFYRRRCALILRAADEAAWQPIESAPHNVKLWLGWRGKDKIWRTTVDWATYDWKCGDYASGVGKHPKATHWQPISSPPGSLWAPSQETRPLRAFLAFPLGGFTQWTLTYQCSKRW